MINLTVKTLDSRNHVFSVEDEITIAQFKEQIAETVNIPADTQRLIYCGRVLQDGSQLKEYDVDGKVVHLVQRAPPSSAARPDAAEQQPQPQSQRRVRGLEYVGTVRLPMSGLENTLNSLPLQSLANSRLNVARRMICRAENILNALENPNRQEQPVQNEPQEEATPVFEARVVIPTAATFAATEPFNTGSSVPEDSITPPQEILQQDDFEAMIDASTNDNGIADQVHSVSSTPEVISPLVQSTENLATTDTDSNNATEESTTVTSDREAAEATNDTTSNNPTTSQNPPTRNTSRTAEFADILDSLNRLHTRLAPFMDQYNTFMREDPVVEADNTRTTQAMINRVSEVCHYLGHAYHSISDIILRVRIPPPRQLMCRPMLIQHSAVVQVDIPIQLEAQINIPSDRNQPPTSARVSTTSSTTPTTDATATTIPPTSASNVPLNTILGIPFMPRSGVRVETYRLPLFEGSNLLRNNNNASSPSFRPSMGPAASEAYAAALRSLDANARASSGTAATTAASTPVSSAQIPLQPMDVATAIASSVVNSLNNITADDDQRASNTTSAAASNGGRGPDNPNLEFFMEVTPESITIDSLETAFVAANQANDLSAILQEGMNPPPPEFIQSIMQMAGQFMNRNNASGSTTSASAPSGSAFIASPSAFTSATRPSDVTTTAAPDASVTTTVGAARTTPFQNSQARGNTQTQPTTATHTRSTPRPHVHLAQHTMHAFDPFLPCNSHHILTRRRLHNVSNAASQHHFTPQVTIPPPLNQEEHSEPPEPIDEPLPQYNFLRNLLLSVRETYSGFLPSTYPLPYAIGIPTPESIAALGELMNAATIWMSTVPDGIFSEYRPTVTRILRNFPETNFVRGDHMINDFIMLLFRYLTMRDIMPILNGNFEPIRRMTVELRNFVTRRILDDRHTQEHYDMAVEKLMEELQSFINHLGMLETRDEIDIVRSVQALARARIPVILAAAVAYDRNSSVNMFEEIRITFQQLAALLLRASRNGVEGVQIVLETLLVQCLDGVPTDLQEWSLLIARPRFEEFMNRLNIPESLLQPYICRDVDIAEIPDVEIASDTVTCKPEAMQVEEIVVNNCGEACVNERVTSPGLITSFQEPVPDVILGSKPWHTQVPQDWVPFIVKDTQRQRRHSSQPPFSDAYLSGMPSKRRKLAECNRPPSSISQTLSESVRRAVTATGLAGVTPLETVTDAVATDINVQSAFRNLLHNSVQSELQDNEDFSPEQFPNIDSYFNNRRQ